jgi:hypothetical protein
MGALLVKAVTLLVAVHQATCGWVPEGAAPLAQGRLREAPEAGAWSAREAESRSRLAAAARALDGRFIASASGAACDGLARRVAALQEQAQRSAPPGSAQAQAQARRGAARSLAIQRRCWVPFWGDASLAASVARLGGVERVDADAPVLAEQFSPPSWGLNRLDQAGLPLSTTVPFTTGYTGVGVNIYVLDTGLDSSHADFGGRAANVADFSDSGEVPWDVAGHGTHTASLAGGRSFGVARDATLLGVKVLGAHFGSMTGVIAGLQFAVDNQAANFGGDAAVASLSLGGGSYQPVDDAARAAAAAGLVVVVAAGNSGADACAFSPARAGGQARATYGPIVVAATTAADARASWSNYGGCVDVLAPGDNIVGAAMGTGSGSVAMSGTSMAAPYVAGIAASLLEKANKNRRAAVDELFATATVAMADANSGAARLVRAAAPRPRACFWSDCAGDFYQGCASAAYPPTGNSARWPSGSGPCVLFWQTHYECCSTPQPTQRPTMRTKMPTAQPTPQPTTPQPTKRPTPQPTAQPTKRPTPRPTRRPSAAPTPQPTESPTGPPTPEPTESPTLPPTPEPTESPTTPEPTESPTTSPTLPPPTPEPSSAPSSAPTRRPSKAPTTSKPTTPRPSKAPTTKRPTTAYPTMAPIPSSVPKRTKAPTSKAPTKAPTSRAPTKAPTTKAPSTVKVKSPTIRGKAGLL